MLPKVPPEFSMQCSDGDLGADVPHAPTSVERESTFDCNHPSKERVKQQYLLAAIEAMVERQHLSLQQRLEAQFLEMQSSMQSMAMPGRAKKGDAIQEIAASPERAASKESIDEEVKAAVAQELAEQAAEAEKARQVQEAGNFQKSAAEELELEWEDDAKSEKEEHAKDTSFRGSLRAKIHDKKFDMAVACLVVTNVVVMFVEMEYTSYKMSIELGLESSTDGWTGASTCFEVMEHFFNFMFVLELVLRLLVDGCATFNNKANIFDALIVALSCLDAYILKYVFNVNGPDISFARVARLCKLAKMSRAFRAAALFSELRILLVTVMASVKALIWSAMLLGFIILCCGLIMAQMVEGCIYDEEQELSLRVWAYEHYGSGVRASYTIFEATLSGGWPQYARPLIMNVHVLYAVFWIPYIVIVVFAIIRVITALFLKNTLKVSEDDAEMMAIARSKEKKKFMSRLKQFLDKADKDGDGMMNRQELHNAVHNSEITTFFQAIGLELHDVAGLFDVLDDGEGWISSEEFSHGIERLKGNARAVDTVILLHEQRKIRKDIDKLKVELLEVLIDVRHQV